MIQSEVMRIKILKEINRTSVTCEATLKGIKDVFLDLQERKNGAEKIF